MKIDAFISLLPTVRRGQAKQAARERHRRAGYHRGEMYEFRRASALGDKREMKEGKTKKVWEEIPVQDANGARHSKGKAGNTAEALLGVHC